MWIYCFKYAIQIFFYEVKFLLCVRYKSKYDSLKFLGLPSLISEVIVTEKQKTI